jgi:hypothetical protein
MLRFLTITVLSLVLADHVLAQTVIDIGAAVGQQSYESSSDDSRVLTSLEVLARCGALGLHVAAEYADLTAEGALFVFHPDLVYRWALPARFAVMIGETGGHPCANRMLNSRC